MKDLRTENLVLSRDEVREIDAEAMVELGISGLVLMENAARGVADTIRNHFSDIHEIVIVCGPGNNGGDGLALARQLSANNILSRVFLITAGKDLTEDSKSNLQILAAAKITVAQSESPDDCIQAVSRLTKNDLIVDCLLGTGVRGAVHAPFDTLINAMNASSGRVLAVDVPSGLNCDDGSVSGPCVNAERTVTFVGVKRGFLKNDAVQVTGIVDVAHIGLPAEWIMSKLAPGW